MENAPVVGIVIDGGGDEPATLIIRAESLLGVLMMGDTGKG